MCIRYYVGFSSCIFLTAQSWSARRASPHSAFMDRSLTVSQTRLPCPPCRKMGLQSWTVLVAINKLPNLNFGGSWQFGGYVGELPAEAPVRYCRDAKIILSYCHANGISSVAIDKFSFYHFLNCSICKMIIFHNFTPVLL